MRITSCNNLCVCVCVCVCMCVFVREGGEGAMQRLAEVRGSNEDQKTKLWEPNLIHYILMRLKSNFKTVNL